MSITRGSDDRRSAWFVASRERLGVTEEFWYDPAVEHLLDALRGDAPLSAAAEELGSARGAAGFDLRETASDLDALAAILPAEMARRVHDEATVAALSAWADAFIDRAHPPSCVDSMTGLVTPAYLRVRVDEVHRECADLRVPAPDTFALVVVRPADPGGSPLARLAARLRAGRSVTNWFPGGETACLLGDAGVVVLARRDHRLETRARGLAVALAHRGSGPSPIEPVGETVADTQRRLDQLMFPGRTGR